MNAPVLTFFNNKGGVGKTSLIYHLAWIFASLDKRVVVLDLDPQASLTAAFLHADKIESIWQKQQAGSTSYLSVKPLAGVGDIAEPVLQTIAHNLYLLPGDIALSGYEDLLCKEWSDSMGNNKLYRPMRILSAFWQVMQMVKHQAQADIVLVDIDSNLGAINRSVVLATDYVAIPLGADLFSLQSLHNLGPMLNSWKSAWHKRLDNWHESAEHQQFPDFALPIGRMQPIGYFCQQHSIKLARPITANDKWVKQIPDVYRRMVLAEPSSENLTAQNDPYCLATIKHYRSLIPMGQEHRKPIFKLTPADGAIGAHANAVSDAKKDFKQLAATIAEKIGVNFD